MVIPFLTIYLTTVLHFDLTQAGILVGSFGIGSLGGSYFGGKLSDRIGPIPVIIASLSLGGSMLFLMAFASSFNSLLLLILLASLFGEAYRPAIGAAVGHYNLVPEAEVQQLVQLQQCFAWAKQQINETPEDLSPQTLCAEATAFLEKAAPADPQELVDVITELTQEFKVKQ